MPAEEQTTSIASKEEVYPQVTAEEGQGAADARIDEGDFESDLDADVDPSSFDIPEPDGSEDADAKKTSREGKPPEVEEVEKASGDEPPVEEGKGAKLSDQSIAVAKRFGFSDEDIAAFKSDAQLDKTMTMLLRRGVSPEAQVQERAPQAQPLSQPAQAVATTGDDGEFKLPAEIDEYDKPIADALKGMVDHFQKRDAVRQSEVYALATFMNRATQMAEVNSFDQWVSGLGDKGAKVFGSGGSLEIPLGEQFDARNMVFRQAKELSRLYPALSADKLYSRAQNMLYGDRLIEEAKQEARTEVKAAIDKTRGMVTGRPSPRKGRPLTEQESAGEWLEKRYKELGITGSGDGDIDDE